MTIYQVTQNNTWACPGMLVEVDDNNEVVSIQQNPDNASTITYPEDGQTFGQFDPTEYKEVKQVK